MYTAALMFVGQLDTHQRDLIADADRYRLLAEARRRRPRRGGGSTEGPLPRRPATGNLAPCGASVAAPAR
jgi:hypothetical protein